MRPPAVLATSLCRRPRPFQVLAVCPHRVAQHRRAEQAAIEFCRSQHDCHSCEAHRSPADGMRTDALPTRFRPRVSPASTHAHEHRLARSPADGNVRRCARTTEQTGRETVDTRFSTAPPANLLSTAGDAAAPGATNWPAVSPPAQRSLNNRHRRVGSVLGTYGR